ncbi:MAG: hypothetical protein U0R44_04380 [Candidatus Micrarchaeia archaeon]
MAKRTTSLTLDVNESVIDSIKATGRTVLRVLCPERLSAFNIVLKNDRVKDEGQESFPQVTAVATWKKVDPILRPGAKVVFRGSGQKVSCTVEAPSRDHFFSEDGLLAESIYRDVN